MILNLLTEDMIKIISESPDWERAAKIAGQLLYNAGKIKKSYIQAMIDYVHKFGPYIVIAPGIALFHARPEDGVKEMGISLVVIHQGVEFNVEGKDPVKVIFALAAADSDSHVLVLSEIAMLLQDEEAVEQIIAATSAKKIVEIIKTASKGST